MTVPDPPSPRPIPNKRVQGTHLHWPMDLTSHGVTCYVVEPVRYEPSEHAGLFGELIAATSAPEGRGGAIEDARRGLRRFDLMTFPEAFLVCDDLFVTLEHVAAQATFPMMHVGLRGSEESHLIDVEAMRGLVDKVTRLQNEGREPDDRIGDLDDIGAWLSERPSTDLFNFACLFTIDAGGCLRVCLHPKNIPSPQETSPLPDAVVTGTDFLTAVSLHPENTEFGTVCLQPLICSDVLDLRTPLGGPGPIEAVTREAGRLGRHPPDHIDIVSVVTCTPLDVDAGKAELGPRLQWKRAFRRAFVAASSRAGFSRHDSALFVLSNFRYGPEQTAGERTPNRPHHGLSGCCMPIPPHRDRPEGADVWAWGLDRTVGDEIWKRFEGVDESFEPKVQLMGISPDELSPGERARLFHFNMPVLPRYQGGKQNAGPTAVSITTWPVASRASETST